MKSAVGRGITDDEPGVVDASVLGVRRNGCRNGDECSIRAPVERLAISAPRTCEADAIASVINAAGVIELQGGKWNERAAARRRTAQYETDIVGLRRRFIETDDV